MPFSEFLKLYTSDYRQDIKLETCYQF
jgi:hypothetical protein